MDKIFLHYRQTFSDRKTLLNMLLGIFLFVFGIVIAYYAYDYTQSYTGHVAQDIFLDNLPVLNVVYFFFGGIFLMGLMALGLCLINPKKIPFVLIATGIFFTIRGFFLVLTHLAPPNIQYLQYISEGRDLVFSLSTGTDLFFSGHVGYAFLLALIFGDNKYLRYFFIIFSVLMAAVVILGHLHYSIDVFSAYFIVFGIFEFSKRFFKREFLLLTD